jgi:hypothetical protein
MEVKGVAFLARQAMAEAAYGVEAWRRFLAEFSKQEPVFQQPVLPVTRLPVKAFLALNDALVRTFHGGDTRAYWQFGEASGRYALTQGQLRGMFEPGEFRRFLQFTPFIWKGYFTEGELQVLPGPDATELRILGVPHRHVYFEYAVMGFAKGGLLALGARALQVEAVQGYSRGDDGVLYRFTVA